MARGILYCYACPWSIFYLLFLRLVNLSGLAFKGTIYRTVEFPTTGDHCQTVLVSYLGCNYCFADDRRKYISLLFVTKKHPEIRVTSSRCIPFAPKVSYHFGIIIYFIVGMLEPLIVGMVQPQPLIPLFRPFPKFDWERYSF